MRRLLVSGLSLVCLALAASATSLGLLPDERPKPAATTLPHHLGAIHPRLSPDGNRLAVSYQGAICTIPRDGGTLTRLTDGAGFDLDPAWSPDGQRIAYVNSLRMSNGQLRVIDAASGKRVNIPEIEVVDSVSYTKLDFHPDGRVLGNLRTAGVDRGLALVDLATGDAKSIVKAPRVTRFGLSRDGAWLVYTANLDIDGQQWGNDGAQADIFKVATSGGEPVKVTRFAARIHDVCWSDDDKSLVVVSDLGGAHYDLWQVPLDKPEAALRLTQGAADEDRPSVSADGNWLAYTDNRAGATSLVVRDLHSDIDVTVPIKSIDFRRLSGRIALKTVYEGRPAASRVSIQQADGKFFAPPGSLHRVLDDYGHFYCRGVETFDLPVGKYRLRAFKGSEFEVAHVEFTVAAGEEQEVRIEMKRWTDPASRGWLSGENHIHANYGYGQWYNTPASMLLQLSGEDLGICNFMVANSDGDGVFDREFFRGRPDPLSTKSTILYWNQEFRSTLWGHMTLVDLDHLVEPIFTGFQGTTNPWDIPTNADIADRTHLQKGLVNYTHSAQNAADPYLGAYTAKGIAVDVALGKIDTIDLNASYAGTIPLWYRLLNCGFRLPPSAGTDCFLNRIRSRLPGADRAYVQVGEDRSYRAWIDGLKAGRSFISSGPMLELSVEDQQPGGTLKLAMPREVKVVAKAESQFPLNKVELVLNGNVVLNAELAGDKLSGRIEAMINIPQSGWLSLRASGPAHPDHSGGPLEAHTAPVYVLVSDQPIASKADAEYFLKWIDRLSLAVRERDRIPSPELRQHVAAQLEAARGVYARMAQ